MLDPLPAEYSPTREALRALVCYVVAPARWARARAIQLEPVAGAIATPPLDDGTRVVVRGDRLAVEPGADVPITTLTDCAAFLGVALTEDLPHVGKDLPPFEPDRLLGVDAAASLALAGWFSFGDVVLRDLLGSVGPPDEISAAHLWPEHFDLGVVVTSPDGRGVNVGVSPGDSFSDEPYLYVGPWDMTGLTGPIWNAPFGAIVTRSNLATQPDERVAAARFFADALAAARG